MQSDASSSSVNRFPLYLAALVIALCVAGLFLAGRSSANEAASAAEMAEEKALMDEAVLEYLRQNPDLLIEAWEDFHARQADMQKLFDEQEKLIAENAEAIFENPHDYVAGNPDGDVTLVEFFDYQCGYCKLVLDKVMRVVEKDGNVRLVLKEYPVLGEESLYAARAAIAAMEQDKYLDFHVALMEARGRLTADRVLSIASDTGLDTARLEQDLKGAHATDVIEGNYDLGRMLGVRGTPAFIVGGHLFPGALSEEDLTALIAEARANAS